MITLRFSFQNFDMGENSEASPSTPSVTQPHLTFDFKLIDIEFLMEMHVIAISKLLRGNKWIILT